MGLNKGIWDPKRKVLNIKGTNLKSLNVIEVVEDVLVRVMTSWDCQPRGILARVGVTTQGRQYLPRVGTVFKNLPRNRGNIRYQSKPLKT